MTYDDGVLRCKSVDRMFVDEQNGYKPNTVRAVPVGDVEKIRRCRRIVVSNPETGIEFERVIEKSYVVTPELKRCGVLVPSGTAVVVICWRK